MSLLSQLRIELRAAIRDSREAYDEISTGMSHQQAHAQDMQRREQFIHEAEHEAMHDAQARMKHPTVQNAFAKSFMSGFQSVRTAGVNMLGGRIPPRIPQVLSPELMGGMSGPRGPMF